MTTTIDIAQRIIADITITPRYRGCDFDMNLMLHLERQINASIALGVTDEYLHRFIVAAFEWAGPVVNPTGVVAGFVFMLLQERLACGLPIEPIDIDAWVADVP